MQQFDYSKGKNASDMAMVIDALDLLYSDRPEAFGIVSSDADFTPLVMYLRAKGAAVYGFGAQKTPEPFVNACSRFLYLDKLATARSVSVDIDTGEPARDDAVAAPLRVPTAKLKGDRKLVELLRNAVEAAAGESGWARVGAVGQQIGNQASFDPRNFGYATLTKLLKATDLFQLTRKAPRRSRCATSARRAARRPERRANEKGGPRAAFSNATADYGSWRLRCPGPSGCRLRQLAGSDRPCWRPWSWPCARHGWFPFRCSSWPCLP